MAKLLDLRFICSDHLPWTRDTQRRMLGGQVWDRAKRPACRGLRWQRLTGVTQASGWLRQAPFLTAHCGPASPLTSSAKAHPPHTPTSISASTEWPFCPFPVPAGRTAALAEGRAPGGQGSRRDVNNRHNPDRAHYIHEIKGPKRTRQFLLVSIRMFTFYCININCWKFPVV